MPRKNGQLFTYLRININFQSNFYINLIKFLPVYALCSIKSTCWVWILKYINWRESALWNSFKWNGPISRELLHDRRNLTKGLAIEFWSHVFGNPKRQKIHNTMRITPISSLRTKKQMGKNLVYTKNLFGSLIFPHYNIFSNFHHVVDK